jgi:hypothetical protein
MLSEKLATVLVAKVTSPLLAAFTHSCANELVNAVAELGFEATATENPLETETAFEELIAEDKAWAPLEGSFWCCFKEELTSCTVAVLTEVPPGTTSLGRLLTTLVSSF